MKFKIRNIKDPSQIHEVFDVSALTSTIYFLIFVDVPEPRWAWVRAKEYKPVREHMEVDPHNNI